MTLADGIHRRLGQLIHFHEPLVGQIGFDRGLAAVRMGQIDLAVFDFHEQLSGLHVAHDLFPRLIDRQAGVRARIGVEFAVWIEDVDHRQTGAQPDFVVIGIVRRSDLDAAAAQFGLGPGIGDQRDLAFQQRQPQQTPVSRHVAQLFELRQFTALPLLDLVQFRLHRVAFPCRCHAQLLLQLRPQRCECLGRIRVHGDRRVAQHGFGTSRRQGDVSWLAGTRIDHRVAKVPEVAGHRFVEHFVVADGRLQEGVPVDEAFAPVDAAGAKQVEEGLSHGPCAHVVQRKTRALPVATAADLLQLAQNSRLISILPVPDPPHECLAPQIVPRLALFLQ